MARDGAAAARPPANKTQGPMVRKKGLEPLRGYPLEPKSSASTNSATFASFAGLSCGFPTTFLGHQDRRMPALPRPGAMATLRQRDAFYGLATAQHKRMGPAFVAIAAMQNNLATTSRAYLYAHHIPAIDTAIGPGAT